MATINVTVTLDVDPDDWANEYGLETDREIEEHLVPHLQELVAYVVREQADRLGTIKVTDAAAGMEGDLR